MDLESLISGPALIAAYILIIAGIVLALLGFIFSAIGNFKILLRALLGIAVLGILFLIGYFLSGNEVSARYIEYGVTTPNGSQMIGGILSMMYLMFGLAILSILAGFVIKLVR